MICATRSVPSPYLNAISHAGAGHLTNIRFPGSPGGYHLTTERGDEGYFAHYDAANPLNGLGGLNNHGVVVGYGPLGTTMPPSTRAMASQTFEEYCNANP